MGLPRRTKPSSRIPTFMSIMKAPSTAPGKEGVCRKMPLPPALCRRREICREGTRHGLVLSLPLTRGRRRFSNPSQVPLPSQGPLPKGTSK